ncbi:GPW/gp25 family protein [Thermopolyspora sp. NPDC052614]|uniref:GPW/gp25 family protein n=1 Tax=Thermopolyspora sp. NPDC052614 TaxID=3155682 RepID=UPI003430D881
MRDATMMGDTGAVLGRGVGFPPRIGRDGRLAWSVGEPNIREAIQIVLMTRPGERPALPGFGGGLDELLFAPNTVATRHEIAGRIRTAITDWEPRVTVHSVRVDPDPADPDAAVATVTYQLVATGDVSALTMSIALAGTGRG